MKKNFLHKLLATVLFSLVLTLGSAQSTIWPGDVNNNGIVNSVDVLYWATVQDRSNGPKRSDNDSAWRAIVLDMLWNDTIPGTDLDIAFADCNGDGKINQNDLKVIEDNFGLTREGFEEDTFRTGDPEIVPTIQLSSQMDTVRRGNKKNIDLDISFQNTNLASDTLFAIAFDIVFDTSIVKRKQDLSFKLPTSSWFGQKGRDVRDFVIENYDEGRIHVVLYRTEMAGPVVQSLVLQDPFAQIIAVVDIVLGIDEVDFGLDNAMWTDKRLEEQLLAIENVEIPVADTTMTTSIKEHIIDNNHLNIYPIPAGDWINIKLNNEYNSMNVFEITNTYGQTLFFETPNTPTRTDLDISKLPAGYYFVKVFTEKGIIIKPFVKN